MSSGCGLKNSGCPSSSGGLGTEQGNAPAQPGANENDETTSRRFIFVDGKTGSWSTLEKYQEIVCPVGSIVVFHYPTSWHDVVALPSQEAYDTCDFDASDVTILSPTLLPNSTYPDVSYYHPCTEPGTIEYLTCSVPGHCLGGQRIKIRTSETDFAFDPDTEEWILHGRDRQQRISSKFCLCTNSTHFLLCLLNDNHQYCQFLDCFVYSIITRAVTASLTWTTAIKLKR